MQTLKFLFMAALLTFTAAVGAVELQQGREYDLINPPQPTDSKGKIEVIEFFSYGCPHCNHFEPVLSAWLQRMPADVSFKRIPLSGGANWLPTAKLFFALESMGVESKLHSDIFFAIHGDRSLNPIDESAIAAWVARKGVDPTKFSVAYGFSGPKAEQAVRTTAAYGVTGVPTMVVDGRYRIRNEAINSYEDLMTLTEAVIEKARADHPRPHADADKVKSKAKAGSDAIKK